MTEAEILLKDAQVNQQDFFREYTHEEELAKYCNCLPTIEIEKRVKNKIPQCDECGLDFLLHYLDSPIYNSEKREYI